ncbi:unnamed protein product [Prorocentrum cordatum]|uniref:Uncharacterized protein n=1 Tax=Prorocentrum cordatum TaxID=2364126 RepID=A0ABN9QTH2_9DINO|nr:unnamed protein product [Polarella glacialis]
MFRLSCLRMRAAAAAAPGLAAFHIRGDGQRAPVHCTGDAPQFRSEIRASWDAVDDHFQIRDIFGSAAADVIMRHAARASHREFPFGASLMAQLMACPNGARTQIFPGSLSPLALPIFNMNYPQTRKSSGFSTGNKVASAMDEAALEEAKRMVATARDVAIPDIPPVRVNSNTLTTFTEAAFSQRRGGDWDQIYHRLVNVDEIYKYLKLVGCVSSGASGKSDAAAGSVTDAASEVGKLFQTGTAPLATRTAGAFGRGDAPTISLGVTGNGHPAIMIPMLRGEHGSDIAACCCRHIIATGAPVEPRQLLPRSSLLPAHVRRWVWPQLLDVMVEPLELPDGVAKMDVAQRALQLVRSGPADAEDSNGEGEDDGAFAPNAGGYRITLAGGTATRPRFKKQTPLGPDAPAWVPKIRAANRDAPIPADQELRSLAKRVLEYFREPHTEVPWKPAAHLTFKRSQAVFDAQAAKARDSDAAGAVGEAARLGAAPWHLGMLTVALLVLEIAVEVVDAPAAAGGAAAAAGGAVDALLPQALAQRHVEVSHCARAHDPLRLFHRLFDDGRANPDRRGPRITLELPPAQDEEAVRACHERLMGLCGIGYTSLCEAIRKRSQRKAAEPRALAQRLAFPNIKYVIDHLHTRRHVDVDPWCLENCVAGAECNQALLEGVNASVREQIFSRLGQHKFAIRWMDRLTSVMFLHEMAEVRNRRWLAKN